MNAQQIKENVIRAEGYAQGFKDGYTSCSKHVVEELERETKESKEVVAS